MIKINMPDNEQLIQELESEVARLKEENKELTKTVEFYGKFTNWSPHTDKPWLSKIVQSDTDSSENITFTGGRLARETINKIQELREE